MIKKNNKWISTKDKLPKEDELVLVICEGNYTLAYYSNDLWWNSSDYLIGSGAKSVDYWLPLPQMPNSKK